LSPQEGLGGAKVSARCRRCGRRLTHPSTFRRGIGKECASKGETKRSRTLAALEGVQRDLLTPSWDREFATEILARMQEGRPLTAKMDRWALRLVRKGHATPPAPVGVA
jgi:hypothetical protein